MFNGVENCLIENCAYVIIFSKSDNQRENKSEKIQTRQSIVVSWNEKNDEKSLQRATVHFSW